MPSPATTSTPTRPHPRSPERSDPIRKETIDMTAPTEVKIPDIGDFGAVPIIEVHVSAGDQVNAEDPLVTLESDKATMDIPAPVAGAVAEVLVKVGDEVSVGSPLLLLIPGDGAVSTPPSLVEQQEPAPASAPAAAPAPAPAAPAAVSAASGVDTRVGIHAGPSVRRTPKEDLLGFRKRSPQPPAAAGAGIREIPAEDFSTFGPIDTAPLPRIKKVSGPFLHRSWLNVPHVTHNDEADITDL